MLARSIRLPNGYARRHGCRVRDFDPRQLQTGTKVEMEHTSDPAIARQIALDHLCEDRTYYKKLAKIHLDDSRFRYRSTIGDASCSNSPRWVRGGVGFLLGTLLGSMIGGGVALAITTTQASITEPIETIKRARNMAVLASGVTVVGAIAGLAIGARQPEC